MERTRTSMKDFYRLYEQVKKGKDLRVHTSFKAGEGGYIKIYQGLGSRRTQILKVEIEKEESQEKCYERAISALKNWESEQ